MLRLRNGDEVNALRVAALATVFAVGACAGVRPDGSLASGIPSPSGYYNGRDAEGPCIHVLVIQPGLSGYHAGVLRDRLAAGERTCDGSKHYDALAYAMGGRAPQPVAAPLPNGLSRQP